MSHFSQGQISKKLELETKRLIALFEDESGQLNYNGLGADQIIPKINTTTRSMAKENYMENLGTFRIQKSKVDEAKAEQPSTCLFNN